MIYGSVCSGIESASVAWDALGWRPAWFSEIEPFPCAVLAHHWPKVPNLGDMTLIADQIKSGVVAAPDVLVGGTPCQAFSVAGLRGGMSDKRGALTIHFLRLANEIDAARHLRGQQPAIIVWENVPGVLSSKDNAFGCFLAGLAGEEYPLQPPGGKWTDAGCVYGSKRAVAWRILDAQYFGLAQRRRRVFVVASARDGLDPTEILFEFDGLRRDTPPSREAGQTAAGTLASRTGAGGFRMAAFGECADDGTAGTMKARDYKGAADLAVQPVCFSAKDYGGDAQEGLSPTLRAGGHSGSHANAGVMPAVVYGIPGNWIGRAPENGGNAVEPMLDISPCQTSADRHGVAYAVGTDCYKGAITGDVACTMGTPGSSVNASGPTVMVCHGTQDPCVSDSTGGDRPPGTDVDTADSNIVTSGMAVRRLTPSECEALQGFPRGHTLVPYRTKPAADGPRYKALGNSMAVPCMAWIGRRIQESIQ